MQMAETNKISADKTQKWPVAKKISTIMKSFSRHPNIFFGVLFFVVTGVGIGICFLPANIRLDQYMDAICTTTAAVVSTMFGLTAASYAFVRSDMQNEEKNKPHLGETLFTYHHHLWKRFIFSLVITVFIVLSSLLIIGAAQNITTDNLFNIKLTNFLTAYYDNPEYQILTFGVAINIMWSILAVLLMANMNYWIFKRDQKYESFALDKLTEISGKYDNDLLADCAKSYSDDQKKKIIAEYKILAEELEKIHILERLIDRILFNHQCLGEAFATHQRRDQLLALVMKQSLNNYIIKEDKPDTWSLSKEKGSKRWEICYSIAEQNLKMLEINDHHGNKIYKSVKQLPDKCSLVGIYDDLLSYRNCKLICDEKKISKQVYGHILIKSLKKRSLLFLMRGEDFSDMDLSRVKFSGADLRCANLSNCNLTKAKLLGTNCESADFTNARIPGMFFKDGPNTCSGDIELACCDDGNCDWDPYWSHEATRLVNATFSGADVSRAQLIAPGELMTGLTFPFGCAELMMESCNELFPLMRTNFDHAKLFSSCLKNINLENSSLEKAQMFDTILTQCNANNANFFGALLTNSIMLWCNFAFANLQNVILTNSILGRLNFQGARLQKANFSNSNIVACNFSGAYCQDVTFKNIIQDISFGNLYKSLESNPVYQHIVATLEKSIAHNIVFDYATLTNADFSGAIMEDAGFSHAIGTNCVFSRASANGANFSSALFSSSLFNSSRFTNCKFVYTVFRNSVFVGACFIGGTFYGTDFSNSLFSCENGSCFSNLIMIRVKFNKAQGLNEGCFKNVDFQDVDFTGTGLSKEAFTKDNTFNDDCKFDTRENDGNN